MKVINKQTGEQIEAVYATTPSGQKRFNVNGKFYTDKQFGKLFTTTGETESLNMKWKSHIRGLFDEIIQNGGDKTYYFRLPLQITIQIIAEAAAHAAQIKDDKMIGYFARLGLYAFSDPTNKEEYNSELTKFYCDKTL